jgi:outer membrane protein assembly factor BamB
MFDSGGDAGTDTSGLHECDNCGAQLPAPDANGTRTCTFCHAVYTAPAPAAVAPPPQVNLIINAPGLMGDSDTTLATPEFHPVNEPSKKRGCGCLVPLIVIALIGGGVAFGLHSAGIDINPFKPSYTFGNQLILLPAGSSTAPTTTEAGAPPTTAATSTTAAAAGTGPLPFLTLTTSYSNGSSGKVLRFNGTDLSPVWSSDDLPQADAQSPIATDADHVYVIAKSKLFALGLADGKTVWQATLSDDISSGNCGSSTACLSVIGEHAIVQSSDGNLQAFDRKTGALAWKRQLESTSTRMVRTTNNLILLDQQQGTEYDAISVNLDTGADLAVIDPVCERPTSPKNPSHAGSSSIYEPSPDGASLVVFFESSPSCIQSFDPATGALQWNVAAGKDPFTAAVSIMATPFGWITATSNSLGVIDAGHTSYRVIVSNKDLTFTPLGLSGANVITEVKNTRGTTKTSIDAVNAQTGATTWEVSFGKASSLDGFDAFGDSISSFNAGSDGSFSANLANDVVYVVTMIEGSGYDHTLSIDSIDAKTGTPSPHISLDAQSRDLIPSFGPPRWSGAKVVARVGDDTMQTIDAAAGKVTIKIP